MIAFPSGDNTARSLVVVAVGRVSVVLDVAVGVVEGFGSTLVVCAVHNQKLTRATVHCFECTRSAQR